MSVLVCCRRLWEGGREGRKLLIFGQIEKSHNVVRLLLSLWFCVLNHPVPHFVAAKTTMPCHEKERNECRYSAVVAVKREENDRLQKAPRVCCSLYSMSYSSSVVAVSKKLASDVVAFKENEDTQNKRRSFFFPTGISYFTLYMKNSTLPTQCGPG